MAKMSKKCKTGGMTNPNKASINPKPKGIGPSSPVKKFKAGGSTSYKGKPEPVAKVASVSKTGVMKKGGSTKKYLKGGASKAKDKAEDRMIPSTTYNANRKAPGLAENKLAVARNDKGIKDLAKTEAPKKTTVVAKKSSTTTTKSSNYPKTDKNYVNKEQKPVMVSQSDAIKVAEGMDKEFKTTEYTDRLKEQMGRGKSTPIETNKMSTVKINSTPIPTKTIPTVSTKNNQVAMKRRKPKKSMGGNSSKKAGILSGMDYAMPEDNSGILSMKKGGMSKKAKGGTTKKSILVPDDSTTGKKATKSTVTARGTIGKMKSGGTPHPGFKAVQNKIASKEGVSKQAAGAILASSTRNASKAAKRANPRLKKVRG